MDPLIAIIVLLVVALIVWVLGLPGIVLAGALVIILIALLLPYAGGIRRP